MDLTKQTDLRQIGEWIRAESKAMHAEMSRSVERACAIGQALEQAKAMVPHGQWEDWIASNVPLSAATCRKFMDMHRNRDQIEDAPTFRKALATLAESRAVIGRKTESESRKSLPVNDPKRAPGAFCEPAPEPTRTPEPAEPQPTADDFGSIEVVCDKLGNPVEDAELIDVFAGEEWGEIAAALLRAEQGLKRVVGALAGYWLDASKVRELHDLRFYLANYCAPYAVYPPAARERFPDSKGTEAGFLPKKQYQKLPEDMKS